MHALLITMKPVYYHYGILNLKNRAIICSKYSFYKTSFNLCQTWNLTIVQKKHLQVCQRKMEWKILGISLRDRIPNTRRRELAKSDDMVERTEILKWKWGGHQGNRCAQISMMWNSRTGRRQRDTPASRWWIPSRISQECTGPELQGVESTGKLYRESCREKNSWCWRPRRSCGLAHHMSFD